MPRSLKNSTPEDVATQLWLAPLFGTLCGGVAKAPLGKANTAPMIIAARALRLFVNAMSLLVTIAKQSTRAIHLAQEKRITQERVCHPWSRSS